MTPEYILRKIDLFEASAAIALRSTTTEEKKRHIQQRLNKACYLRVVTKLQQRRRNLARMDNLPDSLSPVRLL